MKKSLSSQKNKKTKLGKKKQLNCYHCGEKGYIKLECPKYRATTNTTVEGVPSEVGGNENEAKGSDNDGCSVTSGVTQSTKGEATVDIGCSFNFTITSEDDMNVNEKDEFVFFEKNKKQNKVKQMWILLDSQSTIDVFVNDDFLKSIQVSDKPIRIHSQAGMSVVNEIGDFGPTKNVWLDRNGIANILSLSKLLE